jgi:hypothetical protein
MIGLFDQIVPYFLLQQHSVQPLLDEQNWIGCHLSFLCDEVCRL